MRSLLRPTAALFPLAGLVAAFLTSAGRDFICAVFLLYFLMQLVGLCAAESFRNAAAQEPGVRRVDRRFGGALLQALIAAALVLALCFGVRGGGGAADHGEFFARNLHRAALAAAFLNIEHLFEERMFALGRRVDGVILSCVGNGLLLLGALLDAERSAGAAGGLLTAAAGVGAALSVVTTYLIEAPHSFLPPAQNFAFFPRACLQTLLYPAAACGLALLLAGGDGARLDAAIPAILFGLIPWRLARTTARRTPDESRPLNLLLIVFAAIPAILVGFFPFVRAYAQMAALAAICGAAVFCAPGARLCLGLALIVAANLPLANFLYLNAIFALAAVGINAKRAFLRKV